jgi:hypothetical protein
VPPDGSLSTGANGTLSLKRQKDETAYHGGGGSGVIFAILTEFDSLVPGTEW